MLNAETNFQICYLNKSSFSIKESLFLGIKNKILGKRYDLSLVFITSLHSRKLNKKYRGKDRPANVLSFELSKISGEVFIDQKEAAKNAPKFEMDTDNFLVKLYTHGLLHLKGYKHGNEMDSEEARILSTFLFI